MIKVWHELTFGNMPFIAGIVVGVPMFMMFTGITEGLAESINRDLLSAELQKQLDDTIFFASFLPIIIIGIFIIIMSLRSNAITVIKTANVEKRMEKLKKLGVEEFIKQTEAKVVNTSPRGNTLYASDKIIEGRTLKFLVYKDKSTPREYISFVRDEFTGADEAMASKFSLSGFEYNNLKVENEA